MSFYPFVALGNKQINEVVASLIFVLLPSINNHIIQKDIFIHDLDNIKPNSCKI